LKEQRIDLARKLRNRPITVIDKHMKVTIENIRKIFPGGHIAVCDCYVQDIEKASAFCGGFVSDDGIMNIDHHSPDPRMAQFISSSNLAIACVKKHGPLPFDTPVIINHCDCDSVLSSAIMAGFLQPEDQFGQAAIAADHTGEDNEIANLLQALQPLGNLEFSLRNLGFLLNDQTLDHQAVGLLRKRIRERETLKALVGSRGLIKDGEVTCVIVTENLDAGLLPALLPSSGLAVMAFRKPGDRSRWHYNIRLCQSAIGRYTLHELDVRSFDESFGGRWNAGSNKRGKVSGSTLLPQEYVGKLSTAIQTLAH
jgi:hypothetical protein